MNSRQTSAQKSMKSHGQASKFADQSNLNRTANNDGVIRPPGLPSNLAGDAQQEATFNSIGFYGDLIARLDE